MVMVGLCDALVQEILAYEYGECFWYSESKKSGHAVTVDCEMQSCTPRWIRHELANEIDKNEKTFRMCSHKEIMMSSDEEISHGKY